MKLFRRLHFKSTSSSPPLLRFGPYRHVSISSYGSSKLERSLTRCTALGLSLRPSRSVGSTPHESVIGSSAEFCDIVQDCPSIFEASVPSRTGSVSTLDLWSSAQTDRSQSIREETLRGINATYVREGSPVCIHSWPGDLVGRNQSSEKRFRVLMRVVAPRLQAESILAVPASILSPLDLRRWTTPASASIPTTPLLRHQLPPELQEHRRAQGLGEDVRLLFCRRHPLEHHLPLLH